VTRAAVLMFPLLLQTIISIRIIIRSDVGRRDWSAVTTRHTPFIEIA